MTDELRAAFCGERRAGARRSDREAAIAFLLEAERPYAGGRGLDEEAMREVIGRAYDRSPSPASANNHFMVDGRSFPAARLGRSTCRCSSSTAPTTRCSRPRTARRSRPPSPARGCSSSTASGTSCRAPPGTRSCRR